MALTGRLAPARALGGVLVVGVRGVRAGAAGRRRLRCWSLRRRVDLLLAGSVARRCGCARVRRHRRAARRAGRGRRCSSPTRAGGGCAACVRDAWPPSAGRRRPAHAARPAARRAARADHRADCRPGAATGAPTGSPSASLGPLGLAARQGVARACRGGVRVLPPFASRKHLPGQAGPAARARRPDRACWCAARAPSSTRCASTSPATTCARSTGGRPPGAGDVVVRTWRPERDRHVLLVLDTGRTSAGRVGDAPRLDAAMDAALLLAALASRAGDRVDLLAYDRRVRAAVQGAAGDRAAAVAGRGDGAAGAGSSRPTGGALAGEVLRRAPQRSLVVLLTAARPGGRRGGPAAGAGRGSTARHQVRRSPRSPTRGSPRWPAARGDAERGVRRGGRAERGARAPARTRGAGCSALGVDRGRRPTRATLPPALADRYLALKAAGRL